MTSDRPIFTALTLLLGSIGLLANAVLVLAIIFRTPSHMRVYSRILMASALCDIAGVMAMMLTCTKEKIFTTACILEFHGYCTAIGVDFCCAMFGVQEHIYSATCLLLHLSFVYRLCALENSTSIKQNVINLVIVIIIVFNSLAIALYHHVLMNDDWSVSPGKRTGRANDWNSAVLGAVHLCNMHVLDANLCYSVHCFCCNAEENTEEGTLSIASRNQHQMLVKALNMQLTVSAFFLFGCGLFLFNLIILNLLPSFPETTEIIVPLCNLQNVIGAFTNIYVITPYRRWVTCSSSRESTIVRTFNLSMPNNEINSRTSAPARL